MHQHTRVLLVDTCDDEREMYAVSLRRSGFCTLQAANAADAWRLASEMQPAAIITDVRLAGDEDGLVFTRRVKQDPRMRDVPVVIVTANVLAQDREAAARSGCDRVIVKPCLPDHLARVIHGLVRHSCA